MKKKITCFVLAIVMVSLLVCPAYAIDTSEEWILVGDADYITHGDSKYYPMEFPHYNFVNYNLYSDICYLSFSDNKLAQIYSDSYIYVTDGVEDKIVELVLYKNGEYEYMMAYVEEGYYAELEKLKNGTASSYVVENEDLQFVTIDNSQFDAWCRDDRKTIVGVDVYDYDWYFLYGCDASGTFMHEVGIILVDYFDKDDMYLLRYDECDPMCFDEYGEFIGHNLESYTIYEIDDEPRGLISSTYDYYDDDYYYDDYYDDYPFDSGEPNLAFAAVFASIIFGLIPLAVITFAVVKLVKGKDKKYRIPYIVLISGAALMLIAFVVLIALLAV